MRMNNGKSLTETVLASLAEAHARIDALVAKERTMEKLAYSINDAIKATSIGKTTLYAHINDGSLRVVRIGGRTIIPAQNLINFINTGRSEPQRAARKTSGSAAEAAARIVCEDMAPVLHGAITLLEPS